LPIFPSSLDDLLFSQRHLGTLIKDQRGKAENAVDQIADDLLLSTPTEDLVSQIGDEVTIPALVLDHNGIAGSDPRFTNMVVGPGGRPITVNAHAYDVDFNYTGASGLFNHQPDTHDNTCPRAKLDSRGFNGTITITAVATDGAAPEEIRRFIDNEVSLIERYIGFQALQLDPFNSTIHAHVRSYVEARKAKILRLRNTAASLGFAMQRRQGAPPTYISPVVRRKLPIALKAVEGYQPEPEMHETDYQSVAYISDLAGHQSSPHDLQPQQRFQLGTSQVMGTGRDSSPNEARPGQGV
jgi:hypothetical protein